MAVLIYDGAEYQIQREDVPALSNAVKQLINAGGGWLDIGALTARVRLYISPGVNIALLEGGPEDQT